MEKIRKLTANMKIKNNNDIFISQSKIEKKKTSNEVIKEDIKDKIIGVGFLSDIIKTIFC